MQPAPRSDKRQERKAHSRERILHEAAAAIRSQGAAAIGVQAVMARAGMTVGGFYAHFASKDDLLAHAVAQMFAERYTSFLGGVDELPPAEVLEQFIERYLSLRHRDGIDQGCPIPPLAGEIGRLADPVRAAFVDGVTRLEEGLAALLRQLDHPDPAELAGSVLAEMIGAISLARIQPDRARAETMLAASRQHVRHRLGLEAPQRVNLAPQTTL